MSNGDIFHVKKNCLNRGAEYRELIGTLHRRRHRRTSRFTATDRPAFIITV